MNRKQLTDIIKHASSSSCPCDYCVCNKCETACLSCGESFESFELKKIDELSNLPKASASEIPTLPLRSNEANAMLELHYLQVCTSDSERHGGCLKNRLIAIGEKQRFDSINRQLKIIVGKLIATLSDDRYNYMMRYSKANSMYIKPSAATKVGTNDDFAAVHRRTIRDLMSGIQNDVCSLCLGEPQEMASCKYRKAIKELCLVDVEEVEEQDRFCIGKTVDWKR